jgi:SOS-response transcriptional repressor LexA
MTDYTETADAYQPQEPVPQPRTPRGRTGLTPQQHRLLQFLVEREAQDLPSPSLQEMTEELGLKSKSGTHRLLAGLEERGHIRRLRRRARSVEVLYRMHEPAYDPLQARTDQLFGEVLTDVLATLPERARLKPSEVIQLVRGAMRALAQAAERDAGF